MRRRRRLIGGAGSAAVLAQATVTPVASPVSATDLQQYDFTGLNLPAGRLLIGIGTRDAAGVQSVSSVLVDGNAASPVQQLSSGASNLNNTALFEFVNPGALTNVTIQVNMTGAVDRCGIDVLATNGRIQAIATSIADDPTAALLVPFKGAVYGYALGVGTGTATWTGATEHTDEAIETTVVHSAAAAEVPAGGPTTLLCNWATAPSAGTGAIFVAIGPP